MNHKALLFACLIVFVATSCGNAEPPTGNLVSEVYTVKAGDTLWDISAKYMEKNTYGPREIREFYHGIIENNYDEIFKNRTPGDIHPGDKLKINYFVK